MFLGKKLVGTFLVFLLLPFSTPLDTITANTSLKDGQFLVSEGQNFVLGFFSPSNSTSNRYVGIWYNKIPEQTVVWVLNRDNPVNGTVGILSISTLGNLALLGQNLDVPVWSTNVSATTNPSSAQLLDTGNLVLYHGDDSKRFIAWQGFDYPTNTRLPNMKLGFDKRTGLNRFLTSWKSPEDPGTGEYSYKMNLSGLPQLILYKGSTPLWRTGPWNGLRWSGIPEMTKNNTNVSYIDNHDEVSEDLYSLYNSSIFSMTMVNVSGSLEGHTWLDDGIGRWFESWSRPKDPCDHYGDCGAFGNCNPNNNAGEFRCTCLIGYEPKSAHDWDLRVGSEGCVRKRGGKGCGNGDGFVKMVRMKVPDTSRSTHVNESLGMKACEEWCLRNCTCVGYTSADITKGEEGSGCVSWHGEMMDMRQFPNGGQDLYIRVDAIELAQYWRRNKRFHGKQLVEIIVPSLAAVVLLLYLAYWLVRRKKKRGRREQEGLLFSPSTASIPFENSPTGKGVVESGRNADLPFFSLSTIVTSTENFSLANKLGQGGFGSVYKGCLRNGQEVAIKRLSDNSGQGIQEFKNEVTLIAKLQHRNLVRLLGYCVEKREKMLIYEYMPNKGLDSFIFDKEKGSLLDWRQRFEITLGICRGMLYLHQDSRLRIIHRDLKASNVLLDASMNPKISDFGMARIFGGEQMEATTNRVVGTYGYMSPEYAMEGLFSIKSDVFSFGVLLLEIISGRKNSSYQRENSLNLIGHVWDLWGKGRALEIVDSSIMGKSYDEHKVLRCIHIGLLCLQEFATDRPTMSEVAFMLCHETSLSSPKQPAFIFKKGNFGQDSSSTSVGAISVYDETITRVEAR